MKKKYPNGKPRLRRVTEEEFEKYRIQAYEPMFGNNKQNTKVELKEE